MRFKRTISAGSLGLVFAVLAYSAPKNRLVADFEGEHPLKRWTFSNGPEFPGASGSLSAGAGHAGQGAILEYRFFCDRSGECGKYVAANWKPEGRVESKKVSAISMWIRCSPEIAIRLRVKDQSGQTLQYNVETITLEHRQAGDWEHIIVPFGADTASGHWGGDGSGWLRGKIAEVGILAEAPYAYPMEGSVGLDDISFVESAPPVFLLDPAAALVPAPPGASEIGPRMGVNDHVLRDERSLDLARAAGFKTVRMDLRWSRIERNGQYRFEQADRALDSFEARGLGALAILDYGHPEHGGETPRSPQDIAAFARYAGAVASHFKGRMLRYEIWNEPNLERFWKPRPNAGEYAALLRAAIAAIRHADPAAQISTGGVSGVDLPFLSSLIQSGAAADANAIAIHPYRSAAPESVVPDLLALEGLVRRALGPDVEVWVTEWGYSSYMKNANGDGHSGAARNRQALWAVREALTAWGLGMPLTVWYDLRDDGPDARNTEDNFGLLDQDGHEKPAMKAMRTLTEATGGLAYAGLMREVPYGVHAMRLANAAGVLMVLWNEKPAIDHVEFSTQNFLGATDAFGARIQPEIDSGEARISLDEGAGPVYLRFIR